MSPVSVFMRVSCIGTPFVEAVRRATQPPRTQSLDVYTTFSPTVTSLEVVEALADISKRDARSVALLERVPVRRAAGVDAVGPRDVGELEPRRRRFDQRIAVAGC